MHGSSRPRVLSCELLCGLLLLLLLQTRIREHEKLGGPNGEERESPEALRAAADHNCKAVPACRLLLAASAGRSTSSPRLLQALGVGPSVGSSWRAVEVK